MHVWDSPRSIKGLHQVSPTEAAILRLSSGLGYFCALPSAGGIVPYHGLNFASHQNSNVEGPMQWRLEVELLGGGLGTNEVMRVGPP